MTTDEALKEIYEQVQQNRENGETDLRGVLHSIRTMRDRLFTAKELDAEFMSTLKSMVPAPPQAITYERGVEILNYVQKHLHGM